MARSFTGPLTGRPSAPFSPLRARGRACAAFVAAGMLGVLGGCAATSPGAAQVRYDLGPAPHTAANGGGALPPLKVLAVTAPQTLSTDGLIYRLGYADAQQTAAYAQSRWSMPPAQLLTQRLRDALSQRGTVLTGADSVRAPVLKVDLDAFEQVFDSRSASHALVHARATLMRRGEVLAQRTFIVQTPAPSPDAAGGAQALAAASDALVAQIAAWVGAQPLALTH